MRIVLLILTTFFIYSCSSVKSLKEDEVLYTGSRIFIDKVDYDDDWKIQEASKKLTALYWALWDLPNGAVFGLPLLHFMPTRLHIYNIFYNKKNPDKNEGISRWIRENFGQSFGERFV